MTAAVSLVGVRKVPALQEPNLKGQGLGDEGRTASPPNLRSASLGPPNFEQARMGTG